MAIRIAIDRAGAKPVYIQIRDAIASEIHAGRLAAETRLPSTRHLAQQLGVNRITVSNAYADLQAEGLIYSKPGSGAYVSPGQQQPAAPTHPADYPLWQQRLTGSDPPAPAVSSAASPADDPGVISFASGMGASELFPADDYRKALQTVLQRDRDEALGYGELAGYYPLRQTIAGYLSQAGIRAAPENILITSGSQQAMNLVGRLLLRPGDRVLVEDPSYTSALDLFHALGASLCPIPMDQDGMQTAELDALLERERPAMIYTIPNFHNPTGASLSTPRRRQLVALAHARNVPILEDEFAGELRYDGKPKPALKSLDLHGNVIYTGTFSTILMPGLRIGFLVAHGPVYQQLLRSKQVNDLSTSELIQRGLNEYILSGRYDTHLGRARRTFRHRRNWMDVMLKTHLPPGCAWQLPAGGLFIWLKLPADITDNELEKAAAREKVSFAPGSAFSSNHDMAGYIRLNFASVPPDQIEAGIRRLAKAIKSLSS